MLPIAKTGVDVPPRKRPPLGLLPSLGPLHGILQPPARLLVEPERLRPVLLRDLLENFDHGVQVLKRIERKPVVAVVHEALRAVGRELMRNHLKHCATSAIKAGNESAEAMYDELVELMYKNAR